MNPKFYFITVNIILVLFLISFVIPSRVSELRLHAASVNIRQRQLAIMEQNYLLQEENAIILANLDTTTFSSTITGKILADVIILLQENGLDKVEFSAYEYAIHEDFIETRAIIVCSGSNDSINAFLQALANYEHHIQIWRVQLTDEAQLRLTFSVFEERRH